MESQSRMSRKLRIWGICKKFNKLILEILLKKKNSNVVIVNDKKRSVVIEWNKELNMFKELKLYNSFSIKINCSMRLQ
jgi:hypothetical protein